LITKEDGKLHTSYSQLDSYLSCPYKWYLDKVMQLPRGSASVPLQYGSYIHEILEYYLKHRDMDEQQLFELYDAGYDFAGIPHPDKEDYELHYELGKQMIYNMFNEPNEAEFLIRNAHVLGVEEPIELELNGVIIDGFIDAVLQDDGIIVIDHKSSKKKFDKKKLLTNLQFPIYAMAIKNKYGEYPRKSLYNFTKLGITQEVEINQKRIDDAVAEIGRIFELMAKRNDVESIFLIKDTEAHMPVPCPLCFYCSFGIHDTGECKYSSSWQPKKKEG